MKAFRTIYASALAALLLSGAAIAQDNAYLTPSKAKEFRQKEEQERIRRIEQRKAQREREKAEYARLLSEQEQVSDWYNRRDMKVTIEQMEDNLDRLDGTTERRPRGGKYSQRMRRFGENANSIVLNNVDRVYILDDMDYDPWTNSYYGRDWGSGVNIHINTYPYYGYSWRYGRWYDPWYYYGGWYDPWYYGGVYDPWYRSRWRDPWYYGGGWGYSYGWSAPSYDYGYDYGYRHGYYDGSHYGSGSTPTRRYNPYGRTAGSYVQRNSGYGNNLGRTDRAVRTRAYTETPRYNSSESGSGYDSQRRYDNSGSRINSRWNSGSTPVQTYTPSRSTENSRTYSPSTPTRSSDPRNTGTYGSGGRRR